MAICTTLLTLANIDALIEEPFVYAKLFDRIFHAYYDSAMSSPVIIEEMPYDPEFERAFAKAERNRNWFSEHAMDLEVFKKYRGRYVAAASGELFVADTPEEIDRLVRDKYPDEVPHVRYIPREKRIRFYSNQVRLTRI